MSHVMRKTAFCICENKDADQLCGNQAADLCLCSSNVTSSLNCGHCFFVFLKLQYICVTLCVVNHGEGVFV